MRTDLVEFLKPLMPVSRKILKEESKDNVHGSGANENVQVYLRRVALVKLVKTTYSAVNIQTYGVGKKIGKTRSGIVAARENSKASKRKVIDCVKDVVFIVAFY